MFFEIAARLALIEALRPASAVAANGPWPTLAKGHVLDSRRVALSDLESVDAGRRAVLSVYPGEAESARRADASDADDRDGVVTLEVIAELAVVFSNGDQVFADADAANDAEAELQLSHLVGQIRHVITAGPTGAIFRKVTKGFPVKITSTPDVLPETGVRLARRFVTITVDMADDCHSDAGGLPEPLATLDALLPENSYAKGQLAAIAASFAPVSRDPLEAVSVTVDAGPSAVGGVTLNQGG